MGATTKARVIGIGGTERYVFVLKRSPRRCIVRDYGREVEYRWSEALELYINEALTERLNFEESR